MTQLLGVRIANLRKQKKLSTKKLETGIISISYLSNIETCKKIPSLETLLFLADRLNVSHQQLVFEEVGNSDLETLFIDLFNCLVRNQMLEAKQKLDEIEHNYSIQMESPIAEISYYLLVCIYQLKSWQFNEAQEIRELFIHSFAKLIDKSFLPIELQRYYYFYEGLRLNLATSYLESINSYQKYLALEHSDAKVNVMVEGYIALNYICLSQYESALKLIDCALDKTKKLPLNQQGNKIQLLYFKGFVYYFIQFYDHAVTSLEAALISLEDYPEMEAEFRLIIHYRLVCTLQEMKAESEKETYLDAFYFSLIAKLQSNRPILKNEYLPIVELFVLFSEKGELEKAELLLMTLNGLKARPQEMDYFIQFGSALCAIHAGNEKAYVEQITQLLKVIHLSNDDSFIQKVKKQASSYFAKQQKYKKSYEILK
ncbi:helix-turn-helix domain-containing protein [Carnobacterium maltaromaticum]|uniref:helix-turn-helix domain-containing protein n=1 Tax=Carnobacterium maltaromaticum TaxID=2751 RepID=UPI0010725848|nr:helix-turn-helix transcriptional regulator [Carnobacterium maltaromaticum]TFJ72844.1 transcriptional regulator [Carnobacterium maltaromaticum]TFJ77621.1 transcriptional regulator [Carnobacterium maltaromaticum]